MSSNQFSGLAMPVFTAFGWAGEDTALTYALSQLELFIESLYFNLPRDTQAQFPYYGLDRASHSVYLASEEDPASGPYIAFFARPNSWEMSLILNDKAVLNKAYSAASARPATFYDFLIELGANWKLRLQQMEYDPESKIATHYKDICNDSTRSYTAEKLAEDIDRATFLNSEDQWLVPFYLSRRRDSEKVSAMRIAVIPNTVEDVNALVPLVRLFTGKVRKAKKKAQPVPLATTDGADLADKAAQEEGSAQFNYIGELLGLHIRRGFINLTPRHWPFFSLSARSETRPVTVIYGEQKDENCAVWRLVPDDQARVVLSPVVHEWLEDHFEAGDYIQVQANKSKDDKITLTLGGVE